ncbi:hypothetical protein [Mesoplasma photuris]|uniref:hypothetical protein n=1 Tax=Mesoplasma photuris TaxID=217731 RepID=UPI0004E230B0|nr:hypothetical protein [Mesoplasma photuris]
MSKRFSELISIEMIAQSLFTQDVELMDVVPDEQVSNYAKNELKLIYKNSDKINEVVDQLATLAGKLADNKDISSYLYIDQYWSRYWYLNMVNKNYLKYTNDFTEEQILEEAGYTFIDVFAPFFINLIDQELSNYLENVINKLDISDWNLEVSSKLNKMVNNGIVAVEVVDKIQYAEDIMVYLSDMQALFDKLNLDENNDDHNFFVSESRQLRTNLSTLIILIQKVLEKIMIVTEAKKCK